MWALRVSQNICLFHSRLRQRLTHFTGVEGGRKGSATLKANSRQGEPAVPLTHLPRPRPPPPSPGEHHTATCAPLETKALDPDESGAYWLGSGFSLHTYAAPPAHRFTATEAIRGDKKIKIKNTYTQIKRLSPV